MSRRTSSTTGALLRILAGALACGLSPHALDQPIAGQNAPVMPTPRIALLIGVGKYAHLPPNEQLEGSKNDVAAIRQLLLDRFGFAESNITTLVDEQATGNAIRQAFQDFAQKVHALPVSSPPAQVLIHFSGHGSQVPDQASGPDRDEDDGLDETLVPHDAKKQAGDEDIRDDEVNRLVEKIAGGGKAKVFVVLDCCHSGTGARGDTRFRQLVRGDLKPTVEAKPDSPIRRKKLPAGVVFLSACHEREVEPEFRDGDKTYGLMTRFLVEVLSEEHVVSRITYELLQAAIINRYRKDRRVVQAPHPQIEASDLAARRASVLGAGSNADRPPYYSAKALGSGRDRVRLQAGKFHGVTAGSLYEIYAKPEDIDYLQNDKGMRKSSAAWCRILQVDATTCDAEVIRWSEGDQSRPEATSLPDGLEQGFAIERHHESASVGIRLKIVQVLPDGKLGHPLAPNDKHVPESISRELRSQRRESETDWLTCVTAAEEACDLVLRIDGQLAALFPATGVAELLQPEKSTRGAPESLRGGWGPINMTTGRDAEGRSLGDYLRAIARARNLTSMAATGGAGASDYQLKAELVEVKQDMDGKVIEPGSDGRRTLSLGQSYRVRLRNLGRQALYITVLELTPDMGIDVVAPHQQKEVKLEPGETHRCDVYDCEALGRYQEIILATREPHDLAYVKQADLPRTRGVARSGGAARLEGELIANLYFQQTATRGRRPKATDSSWFAEVISWQSAP